MAHQPIKMSTTAGDKTPPNYDWMDRDRFLDEYRLELDKEFLREGRAAEWAHRGRRFWDEEDDYIQLEGGDPNKDGFPPNQAAATLSPDEKFLAVSTNAVIRLYDVKSKELVSELNAHKENVERLYFAPQVDKSTKGGAWKAYTLVSSDEHGGLEGHTYVWHLDANGAHHGPLMLLPGELPTFGFANPISNDGSKVITHEKNQSTQSGMRPLEEMPRIVARNLDTLSEYWRLTGHQDGIMWSGWSPDNKWIAEASWDETYGIWNPAVRDRAQGHLIGPSGGQNWVGDFSADGKYIVFSGGSPTKVAVYDVETGIEVAALEHPNVTRDWIRELKWSPVDYSLAVVVQQEIVLWRPLEDNTCLTVFKMESDGSLLTTFNSLLVVKWVDEGKKLIVRDVANDLFLWDMHANQKWRFQRPDGLGLDYWGHDAFFVRDLGKEGAILSLDGDGKLRYWHL